MRVRYTGGSVSFFENLLGSVFQNGIPRNRR
jgi:hypothetical protein